MRPGLAADSGARRPGESLELCRILSHIEMNDSSAVMASTIRAYRIRNVAVATTNMLWESWSWRIPSCPAMVGVALIRIYLATGTRHGLPYP
jgi:hypothetical protein